MLFLDHSFSGKPPCFFKKFSPRNFKKRRINDFKFSAIPELRQQDPFHQVPYCEMMIIKFKSAWVHIQMHQSTLSTEGVINRRNIRICSHENALDTTSRKMWVLTRWCSSPLYRWRRPWIKANVSGLMD